MEIVAVVRTANSKEQALPEPNPNQRRPMPGGETPLQAAPPVPGTVPLPLHPEQRLAPAPAVPIGGAASAGPAGERPLAPAPLPHRPSVPVGRDGLAYPTVVGGERPMAAAPAPLAGRSARPIAPRPEVPLARPGEPRQVGWPPTTAVPNSGYAPATGISPQAANPAGVAGQPYALQQPSQPTPPAEPAWHQPPASPPPVPPPSAGSLPPQPPAERPLGWSPHTKTGPVGTAVNAAIDGHVGPPSAKTSAAQSLRRASRTRSSVLALSFLCVAAVFLIGMLVILAVTLAS